MSANFSTSLSVTLGQNLGGSLPALTISGGMNSFVSVDGMQKFRINEGYSHYNALQLQFERRRSRGLQTLLSYSLAKSSDLESDDTGGNLNGAGLNGISATSLSQIQLPPLAPSDFDIRHSFSAAVSYEIPSLASSWGRVGQAALKDWAVDAIVRASSSPPLNVRIGGVSSDLGRYATQPDVVPGQPFWLAAPGQPGGKILKPDAFTLPPEGVLGDFPRNSLMSPFSISQTDIALRRRFRLTERVTLGFRVEYFNLFNHPTFGGPFAPYPFWGYCSSQPCTGKQDSWFGKVVSGVGALNERLGGGGVGMPAFRARLLRLSIIALALEFGVPEKPSLLQPLFR